MYIPYSFFGSSDPCITASVSLVSGNGVITSGSFVSQSVLYDYYQFQMSSLTNTTLTSSVFNLEIKSGSTQNSKILIVGGGAGGSCTGSIYDTSYTYTVDSAAGGGGGGIIYYENFILSPGLYEIGVGKAVNHGIFPSDTIGNSNNNILGITGSNSYFKNKNIPYPPSNSDTFIAYGGGNQNIRGEYYTFNFGHRTLLLYGQNGGCGGGAASAEGRNVFPSYVGPLDGTLGNSNLGSFNYGPQGFKGGYFSGGDINQGINFAYATGGGGAGTAGQNTGTGSITIYGSNGGAGLTFNMNGTSSMYSGGGAGVGGSTPIEEGTRGGSSFGAGGSGWAGAAAGVAETQCVGNAGVVIVLWPRCTIIPLVSPNYILQSCDTAQIRTVTFSNGPVLTTGQVVTTTNEFFTGSGCWQVAGTTGSAQYENIPLTNIYNNCSTCNDSICYTYSFLTSLTVGSSITYINCAGVEVTEFIPTGNIIRCVKYGTTPVPTAGTTVTNLGTLCVS